ncbi:MAG: Pyridoxine kinase [Spirochaetes bacterium ADurb.Bin269]|nr:MAG: Pyridoxine kinase [Spirochaetes bacterium ADurb.Bin269]
MKLLPFFRKPVCNPVVIASDLPSWGRVALAVGVPVLEKRGIQVCALPTALLSAHGAYPGSALHSQSAFMADSIAHLERLDIRFSALLSGFVAEAAQFDLLEPLVKRVRSSGGLVLVDPVMGDHGSLYSFFNESFVQRMRAFIARADIITPNLTEAALLLGTDHAQLAHAEKPELLDALKSLARLGPRFVAITSAPAGVRSAGNTKALAGNTKALAGSAADRTGVALYDAAADRALFITHARLGSSYPGTGDLFAAELLGRLVSGEPFFAAGRRTVSRVRRSIAASCSAGGDPRAGLRKL